MDLSQLNKSYLVVNPTPSNNANFTICILESLVKSWYDNIIPRFSLQVYSNHQKQLPPTKRATSFAIVYTDSYRQWYWEAIPHKLLEYFTWFFLVAVVACKRWARGPSDDSFRVHKGWLGFRLCATKFPRIVRRIESHAMPLNPWRAYIHGLSKFRWRRRLRCLLLKKSRLLTPNSCCKSSALRQA